MDAPPCSETPAGTGKMPAANGDSSRDEQGDATRPDGLREFHSILFPPDAPDAVGSVEQDPSVLRDLNLDQVIAGVLGWRDDKRVRAVLHAPSRDPGTVRYRQGVFRDLESATVAGAIAAFSDAMRSIHAALEYSAESTYSCHRDVVRCDAIANYCRALRDLEEALRTSALNSDGLVGLRDHLAGYLRSRVFNALAEEAEDIRRELHAIRYSMLIRRNRIIVRKYRGEPDYSARILALFAPFRRGAAKSYLMQFPVRGGLNHIEARILQNLGRLHPRTFVRLNRFVMAHIDFLNETVVRFDRDIQFYVAYAAYIKPLRTAGLPFCYPEVSADDKYLVAEAAFDLALAHKLVKEKRAIVPNDVSLSGEERLIVVSGPNQGGKTTFARLFGQLHYLAGLGCPVPGHSAGIFLPDRIFTHFGRRESLVNLMSRLEEDMTRIRAIFTEATPDSVAVFNEVFSSTTLDDQVFLSRQVLGAALRRDMLALCVSFIDELTSLSAQTVSMVSTVDPDDPGRRTFRIVRRPADGLAYARSLAEKHGVTYDALKARLVT
jgi:DNA mismatch repair protein MutS